MLEKHPVYRFGPFRLDAAAKVLFREDEPLHLTRRAVETLLILAANSPEVVTREEMLSEVWQDRVVDEANLAQNIAVVRRLLNAERGEPAYIETFPGRGYRLHGPVTVEVPKAEPASVLELEGNEAKPERKSSWWTTRKVLLAGVALVVAAAGVTYRVLDSNREKAERTTPVVSVTRLAGREYQPAISPDGSTIAFVWQEGGSRNPGIWVQKLGETAPREISDPAYSWASPVWAPDGNSLACLRFGAASGDIVILSPGGGLTKIVASVLPTRFGLPHFHLDWSPDGKTLAVDDSPSLSQPLSIFLIDLASGARTRLTQPEELIIGDLAPRFSPDGKTVAFIRAFHRSYQELFAVPAASGPARGLTSDSRQVSSLAWGQEGLLFSSSRGGAFRIWRWLPGKDPAPTGVYAEFPIQFTYCARASRLTYSIVQHDPNIWRLSLALHPEWTRVAASSGQDASPQYAPDGKRIAFRSDRSGDEQIWVCDVDGSHAEQVTHGSGRPSVPRWSPDGRKLVFNDAQSTDMFVAEMNDGGWNVNPFGVRGVHPVFSPDGKSIYAASGGSIMRFPAEGGLQPTVVTPTRGFSLDVSPDGDYIYFVREPTDTTLSRVRIASGEVERIISGLVPYCTSCWALASRGIYYLGIRQNTPAQQSIYFLDFRTRKTQLIANYPEPILPIGVGPFSLSPDGKSLLMVRLEPSHADVLRVDNFSY